MRATLFLLFTAVLATLPAGAGELVLTCDVGGRSLPVASVSENGVFLAGPGGVLLPAPGGARWKIGGDLRDAADLVDWSPNYVIEKLPGRESWQAAVTFLRGTPPDMTSENNWDNVTWPRSPDTHSLLINAWIVNGETRDPVVNVTPMLNHGGATRTVEDALDANARNGVPVVLLWSRGEFQRPRHSITVRGATAMQVPAILDDVTALRYLVAAVHGDTLPPAAFDFLLDTAAHAGAMRVFDHLMATNPGVLQANKGLARHLFVAAAMSGRPAVVNRLSAAGNTYSFTKDERTALTIAADYGHHDVFDLLVGTAAKTEIALSAKSRPLELAFERGDLGMAQRLLKAGATLDVQHRFATDLLMQSVGDGSIESVRMLLELGVPARAVSAEDSPLAVAVFANQVEIAALLLEAGTAATSLLPDGETLLHEAARQNSGALIELLRTHGANLSSRTRHGATPLEIALAYGSGEAARAIAAFAPALDLGASNIDSLLESAISLDLGEVIARAMRDGWDAHKPLANGWVPMDAARALGRGAVATALVAGGVPADALSVRTIVPGIGLDAPLKITRFMQAEDGRRGDVLHPEATVTIECLIDPHGIPAFVRILDSSDPELNHAALVAVNAMRLAPPKKGDTPVATRAILPLAFAAKDNRILNLSLVDRFPRAIEKARPEVENKPGLDTRGSEIVVGFIVDAEGKPRSPEIIHSTTSVYNLPTLQAVVRSRFEPAFVNGRPVRVKMQQGFSF